MVSSDLIWLAPSAFETWASGPAALRIDGVEVAEEHMVLKLKK